MGQAQTLFRVLSLDKSDRRHIMMKACRPLTQKIGFINNKEHLDFSQHYSVGMGSHLSACLDKSL